MKLNAKKDGQDDFYAKIGFIFDKSKFPIYPQITFLTNYGVVVF